MNASTNKILHPLEMPWIPQDAAAVGQRRSITRIAP